MKYKALASVFLASSIILSGCTQRLIDFTIVSSKNIDLSRSSELIKINSRVYGRDTVPIILFPLGFPNAKAAMDEAIQQIPGCVALLDGVLRHEFFNIGLGFIRYEIEGTCLIDPKIISKEREWSLTNPKTPSSPAKKQEINRAVEVDQLLEAHKTRQH